MTPRFITREFQVRCLHCRGTGLIDRPPSEWPKLSSSEWRELSPSELVARVEPTGMCGRCDGTGVITRTLEIAETGQ